MSQHDRIRFASWLIAAALVFLVAGFLVAGIVVTGIWLRAELLIA